MRLRIKDSLFVQTEMEPVPAGRRFEAWCKITFWIAALAALIPSVAWCVGVAARILWELVKAGWMVWERWL